MQSLFHVKSVYVLMFEFHIVNKLHLGSSLRSPSMDSLQRVTKMHFCIKQILPNTLLMVLSEYSFSIHNDLIEIWIRNVWKLSVFKSAVN